MKLVISSALLNAASASITSIAIAANEMEMNHSEYKELMLTRNQRNSEILGITLEEQLKKESKKKENKVSSFVV